MCGVKNFNGIDYCFLHSVKKPGKNIFFSQFFILFLTHRKGPVINFSLSDLDFNLGKNYMLHQVLLCFVICLFVYMMIGKNSLASSGSIVLIFTDFSIQLNIQAVPYGYDKL